MCVGTCIILRFVRKSCQTLLQSSQYLQPIKTFPSFLLTALKYSNRWGKKGKKWKKKCYLVNSQAIKPPTCSGGAAMWCTNAQGWHWDSCAVGQAWRAARWDREMPHLCCGTCKLKNISDRQWSINHDGLPASGLTLMWNGSWKQLHTSFSASLSNW